MAEMSLGNGGWKIIFFKWFGAAKIAMQPREDCKPNGSHTKLSKLLNGLSATTSFVLKSKDIHGQTVTTVPWPSGKFAFYEKKTEILYAM